MRPLESVLLVLLLVSVIAVVVKARPTRQQARSLGAAGILLAALLWLLEGARIQIYFAIAMLALVTLAIDTVYMK